MLGGAKRQASDEYFIGDVALVSVDDVAVAGVLGDGFLDVDHLAVDDVRNLGHLFGDERVQVGDEAEALAAFWLSRSYGSCGRTSPRSRTAVRIARSSLAATPKKSGAKGRPGRAWGLSQKRVRGGQAGC